MTTEAGCSVAQSSSEATDKILSRTTATRLYPPVEAKALALLLWEQTKVMGCVRVERTLPTGCT